MPSLYPNGILRYVQDPTENDAVPVTITWEVLSEYTGFFLGDYLAKFISLDESSFERSAFITAIRDDQDCVASILRGEWQTKEVAAILRPTRETQRRWIPATAGELEEIEASVRKAEAKLIFEAFGYSGYHQAECRGNTEADQKAKFVLYRANKEDGRDLRTAEWRDVILDAAQSNDHGFFISLGRTLSTPARLEKVNMNLKRFLVEHWAKRADGLPEFFYLSTKHLVEICHRHLGETVTENEDAMNKIWRRLGLKTLKRARLEPVEGTMQFKRPDGWLYV
jgi:hypothetical protein